MGRLREALLTKAHKGKQPESMGGFQGGRGVCGYWEQVS